MDNKMTLAELTICNTVGTMFEIVTSRHHSIQVEFYKVWLHSEFVDLLYQQYSARVHTIIGMYFLKS